MERKEQSQHDISRAEQSRKDQSRAKDINLNPRRSSDKISDGTYRDKIRWIMETVDKILHFKCSGGQAGTILKWAGGIGDAIVAIYKTGDWIEDKDFMGAIRKELRGRRLWSDVNHADAKAYNNQFDEFLAEKHRGKLPDILSKIGKDVSK